ncbi:hypothetical protein CMI47_09985 [Candidatus Pacearchaeota archaeon]|jgi:hypothetical protein|nr:hypothetical protein [Candidatus Pacearchaeota archaeon]|tara:strand:- start:7506 stop:7919 length:414 start_codon:yes stop_codon:yes gene_type:complete
MKNFKSFMSEHPSYDASMNFSAGGFGDPMVIKKLNALMGKLTEGSWTDGEPVVRQIRSSLSKIGLTFDNVPNMAEESGSFSMPLTLYGGRFGKLPGTPIDEFLNDDGLQDHVEGGLSLEISYGMTEDNCYRINAKIM